MKIYVPDLENYQCFVVRSENVIRAYSTIPSQNSTINYRDYFYNSHYLYQDGSQSFSQYATLPVCLSNDDLTDVWYYRVDLPDISIIIFIFCFIFFYILFKFLRKIIPGL